MSSDEKPYVAGNTSETPAQALYEGMISAAASDGASPRVIQEVFNFINFEGLLYEAAGERFATEAAKKQ